MGDSSDIVRACESARKSAVLHVRTDRGLLEVVGKDRLTWLHNLVTNAVKTLQPGDGNYAFATNVKGRVVFDVNMLVLSECLWLDVDRRWVDTALKHLSRYAITEDVSIRDRTAEFARLAVIGPRTADVLARLGVAQFSAKAQLQHGEATVGGVPARVARHDFIGLPAAELLVPVEGRSAVEAAVRGAIRQTGLPQAPLPSAPEEIGPEGVAILRIEAGIPASVDDIDEDVVPPETGQVERGISYHKGCYLGQEVIERMRSHGVLARRLVGLRIEGEGLVSKNTPIKFGEKDVGRVTSCCRSVLLEAVLALGYVKTAHAAPGTRVTVGAAESMRSAEIVTLPVARS